MNETSDTGRPIKPRGDFAIRLCIALFLGLVILVVLFIVLPQRRQMLDNPLLGLLLAAGLALVGQIVFEVGLALIVRVTDVSFSWLGKTTGRFFTFVLLLTIIIGYFLSVA